MNFLSQETNVALSITNGCSLLIFFLDIYLNFYRKIKQNLTLGATYQVSPFPLLSHQADKF